MDYGIRQPTRTGVDCITALGIMQRYDLDRPYDGPVYGRYQLPREALTPLEVDGYIPMVSTRRIPWKSVVVELLWFLTGKTSTEFLHRHGVGFWDDWSVNGEVIPGYGPSWRGNAKHGIDQIKNIIDTLSTPKGAESRRLVCNAWDADTAWTAALPPCHTQWMVRSLDVGDGTRRLSLSIHQRSNDWFIGVPFNLASYGLLACILARITKQRPWQLLHYAVDAHIYASDDPLYDHVSAFAEQHKRKPASYHPALHIAPNIQTLDDIIALTETATTDELMECFRLEDYVPHAPIVRKAAV